MKQFKSGDKISSVKGRVPLAVKLYYSAKPVVPRKIQLMARRKRATVARKRQESNWPIMPSSAVMPDSWKGWKDGKQFALILTHDIDTVKGYYNVLNLLEIERKKGFLSAFYFVPEQRYSIDTNLLKEIESRGFEIGVHGLNHDGKLISSKRIFMERAQKINEYLKNWQAKGFRAPSMHHDLDLFKRLNIQYDCSTFDTDPFEPQSDGVNTIFPFRVVNDVGKTCYWELPYTLAQDFTLFILLKETNIDLWTQKLDWIAQNKGMALLDTHPDYMNFNNAKLGDEEYSAGHYENFLDYVKTKYATQYWNPLPQDMVRFLNEIYG